jgi:hypothetical protein
MGMDQLNARRVMQQLHWFWCWLCYRAYLALPMPPDANLYRVLPWSNRFGGYIVYRHCFDETKCSIEDGAAAHKQAVFVERLAAEDYCAYRNRLIDLNGDDRLPPGLRS